MVGRLGHGTDLRRSTAVRAEDAVFSPSRPC